MKKRTLELIKIPFNKKNRYMTMFIILIIAISVRSFTCDNKYFTCSSNTVVDKVRK